jgi:hypothetical protein
MGVNRQEIVKLWGSVFEQIQKEQQIQKILMPSA